MSKVGASTVSLGANEPSLFMSMANVALAPSARVRGKANVVPRRAVNTIDAVASVAMWR